MIFKGVEFPPEPFISSLTIQSFFTSKDVPLKERKKE